MRDLAAGLDVDIDAPTHDTLRPSVKDVDGITLVDDDSVPATCPDDALLTYEERTELVRSGTQPSTAKTGEAIANLTLNPANVRRAQEVRAMFESADEADVGERLLRELVAGETAVALELQDVEAGLVGLLGKAIVDPSLAMAVTKTLREVVGVSNAIRRRMENALGAAENLGAQRRFLDGQRGRRGV